MQEEQTLADPPQRGGAEFAPTGVALRDAVGQSVPHVVEGKVAEWRKAHLALAAIFRLACGLRHDVASVTPDLLEYLPPRAVEAVSGIAVGGAERRMKPAKLTMSDE